MTNQPTPSHRITGHPMTGHSSDLRLLLSGYNDSFTSSPDSNNPIWKHITDMQTQTDTTRLQFIEAYISYATLEQSAVQDVVKGLISFYPGTRAISSQEYLYLLLHTVQHRIFYPDRLHDEKDINRFYAVDSYGNRIYLQKKLHDRCYLGQIITNEGTKLDQEVIVRWICTCDGNVLDELPTYQRLQVINLNLPWLTTDFKFWGLAVLVIQRYQPINEDDNEWQVALDILNILIKIQPFGVHNGIRPSIICQKDGTYILNDYSSLTTSKKGYGYLRKYWHSMWSSQVREPGQITTLKNDLLELGYTIRAIQLEKLKQSNDLVFEFIRMSFKTNVDSYFDDNESLIDSLPRQISNDPLLNYMETVRLLDERNITKEDLQKIKDMLTDHIHGNVSIYE